MTTLLEGGKHERWKPANGTEGALMEWICCYCQHDAAYQAGTGDSCEIAARMYREGSTAEWLVGDKGVYCTSFLAIAKATP